MVAFPQPEGGGRLGGRDDRRQDDRKVCRLERHLRVGEVRRGRVVPGRTAGRVAGAGRRRVPVDEARLVPG